MFAKRITGLILAAMLCVPSGAVASSSCETTLQRDDQKEEKKSWIGRHWKKLVIATVAVSGGGYALYRFARTRFLPPASQKSDAHFNGHFNRHPRSFFAQGAFSSEVTREPDRAGREKFRVSIRGLAHPLVFEHHQRAETAVWQNLERHLAAEDIAWIRQTLEEHAFAGGKYSMYTAGPTGYNRRRLLQVEETDEAAGSYRARYTDELRASSEGL